MKIRLPYRLLYLFYLLVFVTLACQGNSIITESAPTTDAQSQPEGPHQIPHKA
jgi:hypothetical protein